MEHHRESVYGTVLSSTSHWPALSTVVTPKCKGGWSMWPSYVPRAEENWLGGPQASFRLQMHSFFKIYFY